MRLSVKFLARSILLLLFFILVSITIHSLVINNPGINHKLTTLIDSTGLSRHTLYKIPNTSLEVSIPSTFTSVPLNRKNVGMLNASSTPVINLLRSKVATAWYKKGMYTGAYINEDRISIYVEKTNLDPREWLHENVILQGQNFKSEWASEFSFNNIDVVYASISCCGGYADNYLLSHNNQGDNVLVIFATDARFSKKDGRSYLLDNLLMTLTNSANNL